MERKSPNPEAAQLDGTPDCPPHKEQLRLSQGRVTGLGQAAEGIILKTE